MRCALQRSEVDIALTHRGLRDKLDRWKLKNPATPEFSVIVKGVMAAARTRPCSQISTGPRAGLRFEVDCRLEETYTFAALLHYISPRFVTAFFAEGPRAGMDVLVHPIAWNGHAAVNTSRTS